MKKIITIILGTYVIACANMAPKNIEKMTPVTTGETFENIFEIVENFDIPSKIVEMPIHISTIQDKLIVCDYEKDEISVFRNNGKFLFKIKDDTGQIKKLQKPICTYVSGDSVFIASNHGRRILLYKVVNDSKAVYLNSFIIYGSNITPIDMSGFDNKLIMAGYNMYTDDLLHSYEVNGKYFNSFMKVSGIKKENKEGVIQSALNYPFVDFMDNYIYAIEHIVYRLSKFDKEGKEIVRKDIQPDYIVQPSKNLLNLSETTYMKTNNLYSWPIQLKAYDKRLYIQMVMPGKSVFNTPQDYFSQSNYKIDIFNENCDPVAIGIDCASHNLQAIDKERGLFYFITGYDHEKKSFLIKSYKLKRK